MQVPDDHLSAMIRQVARLVGMLERHAHGGVEASASELFALEELALAPLSQNVLGARLRLEKSTVSRLVAGMEAKGWVSRQRDPGNRRLSLVSLSDVGRAAVRHAAGHLHQQHAHLLAALSAKEREALALGVAALARVLAKDEQAQA